MPRGSAFLAVGPDDYPLPIPLVEKDGAWRFDTAAGREEVLYRRIGRNELAAIQACLAYVDAQNEYAEMAPKGGVGSFAQRIVSSPGKKDGLYWPAAAGREAKARSAKPSRPRRCEATASAPARRSTATTTRS